MNTFEYPLHEDTSEPGLQIIQRIDTFMTTSESSLEIHQSFDTKKDIDINPYYVWKKVRFLPMFWFDVLGKRKQIAFMWKNESFMTEIEKGSPVLYPVWNPA